MIDNEEKNLLVNASVLYYLEGKTQSEIAKELFVSRPKVSRLLKKARELGVVDIKINYQTDEIEQLASKIRNAFGIEDVIITKTLSSIEDTMREVGKAASVKLYDEIQEGMTLGISWGRTVRMTASYLQKKNVKDLKIVELFGAFSYEMEHMDMLSIGRSISSKLGGKLYPLPSPIYIKDTLARKAIMETPVIRDTLKMIENCDLIISGLGSVETENSATIWANHVEVSEKKEIVTNGGVGFLCAHFFDENGKFLDMEVNDCVIGIKTESIKKKRSMVVACGEYKAKALLGALRGGLIDILVSDEKTMELILASIKQ